MDEHPAHWLGEAHRMVWHGNGMRVKLSCTTPGCTVAVDVAVAPAKRLDALLDRLRVEHATESSVTP